MQKKMTAKNEDIEKLLGKSKILKNLWENAPCAAYLKDTKGRFVLVNDAYARDLGLRPEQIIGRTDFDIFPQKKAKKTTKEDESVIKTGKPIIDKIEKSVWRDECQNYVSIIKIPRYGANGRIAGIFGMMRNITECIDLECLENRGKNQEKKLKMLEDLDKNKSEFIAAISHELRTPLAIIKQLFLLIYDETAGPINDRQREILVKSRHNIERLKNMIDNLLDMSVLERDALNLNYSLVNLNGLFRDSKAFFKHKAEEKKIRIKYFLPKEEVSIFVDAERIIQVITNLINNAIKFTPENKIIRIEVKLIEADIRIGVIDTGVGIEKADLSKIFEKFTQVSGNVGAREGIGMGLPIVKELVEKHGGHIWVESQVGMGTNFYFTLPRFYTAYLISKKVIEKVNMFLERKMPVYVVNIRIVNYRRFKTRIKVNPKKLSEDLQSVVKTAMRLFFSAAQVESGAFVSDSRGGRYSVIFPSLPEKKVAKFCKFLVERIKNYFLERKIDEVFIAVGISTLSSGKHLKAIKEGRPSIVIREMYIGAEMRQHRRIHYKTKIEISYSRKKKEITETIDLSPGGLCFESQVQVKIDSEVVVTFKLLRKKKNISTKARVAWVGKVELLPGETIEKLKVGLEFEGLKVKDHTALVNELKLYYE